MKMHWLAAGLVGSTLCLVAPARAGELSSWRFDPRNNQLEFVTESGVQPQAQLISEPTRLVIDLPGTTWRRSPVNEEVGGSFKSISIQQADNDTTRIVLEVVEGYTLDPQQIQFRGLSPTQWTVQLPQPQQDGTATAQAPASNRPTFSAVTPASRANPPVPASRTSDRPPTSQPSQQANRPSDRPSDRADAGGIIQVDGVRVTSEGVVVQTRGGTPEIKLEPDESDDRVLVLTIRNAQLSNSELDGQRQEVDRNGIRYVSIEQRSRDRVRVRMVVTRETGEWRANNLDGAVAVTPANRRVAPTVATTRTPSATVAQSPPAETQSNEPATIEGFGFNDSNSQLLIQSDGAVSARGDWKDGLYQVTLSPARLGAGVSTPTIPSNSPLLRARATQVDDETVVVTLHPRSGTVFSGFTAVSSEVIALGMGRSTSASSNLRLPSTPDRPQAPDRNPGGSLPLPSVQNGRVVVAIDPGHGGRDPGAVGIGGVREAEVVLSISQEVARILDQQGVQVVMTRNSDVEVELQPRVDLAEQAGASVFVSIHANAIDMSRPDVNGTTTYYYSSGEDLAQVIQDAAVQAGGLKDRGIHTARFYVLRRTSMPAVLVETAFVTGAEDAPKLADSNWQNRMAEGIASGILQYLQRRSR